MPSLGRGRGADGGRPLRRGAARGGWPWSWSGSPFRWSLVGQDIEEVAYLPLAGYGIGDRQVWGQRVAIASPVSPPGEVAGLLELGHYAVRGPLGDPDAIADFPQAQPGFSGNADQQLAMVREECPPGCRVCHVSRLANHDSNVMLKSAEPVIGGTDVVLQMHILQGAPLQRGEPGQPGLRPLSRLRDDARTGRRARRGGRLSLDC